MVHKNKEVSLHDIRGGIHPADEKGMTASVPARSMPLLEKYIIPLRENIGKTPRPVVIPGDKVKKGQLLAAPDGFVSCGIHAPSSGRILSVDKKIPGAQGVLVSAIELETDGLEEWDDSLKPIQNWRNADRDLLRKRIMAGGVVGMGGAAFPTHVKLTPPPAKTIDTLILNGAECEPYLTSDYRLMLEQPERILEGAAIIARILRVTQVYLGIEDNKPEAISVMKRYADKYNITVAPLPTLYPQGGERQLIRALTGRFVVAGGLPMDVGCVVDNVGTCAAVYDAVVLGQPLIHRYTTVTGTALNRPATLDVRIGTPISELLKECGGVHAPVAKIILGGPMMGFSQADIHVPTMKNTSGVLLLQKEETLEYISGPCIRCGRCVDVCPMHLMPGSISVMIEGGQYARAERSFVMDCMECGCCAYVCPSKRPLVQHFRRAKLEIMTARKAAEQGK